jgi:hypothetical protein
MGVLRLGEKYGSARLEAAAQCALLSDLATYKSMAAILKNGLDTLAPPPAAQTPPLQHDNLRGRDYYRDGRAQTSENLTPSDSKEEHHA